LADLRRVVVDHVVRHAALYLGKRQSRGEETLKPTDGGCQECAELRLGVP
jgi:hypothetical protein